MMTAAEVVAIAAQWHGKSAGTPWTIHSFSRIDDITAGGFFF
jgi:hypothetical protein